jgi:CRISPR-associated protein Csb1
VDGTVVEQRTDLDLPHRAFDAHIRAGKHAGVPVTQDPTYRAARDATPLNASSLLALSPASILFGSWDATRKAHQGRWASVLTGEIIGVLTDQGIDEKTTPRKGGARVDPIGMSIYLDPTAKKTIAEAQKDDLSKKTYEAFVKEKGKVSVLGFGGIPPTLGQLGLVSCSAIIRSHVLSLATLRQIRFGRGAEGDAAIRAVLAALAINGLVRSDAELYLRAHCHLVEDGPTVTTIDRRHGRVEELTLPEVHEVDALLDSAIDNARSVAGLDWHGQVFEVDGDPAVYAGASSHIHMTVPSNATLPRSRLGVFLTAVLWKRPRSR